MRKTGTEQHFFTVRGRGFDHKQWRAVTELTQGIVERAKQAGIAADFEADARRIMITSSEEGVSPLVIWRKGEPGIPKEVTTRGRYDDLVQSILTATKKVAPDIFEMTSPDGRDYRRVLAKKTEPGGKKEDLPEIKDIAKKNREQKDQAFRNSVNRQQWPNPDYKPGTKKQRFVNFSTLPKSEQTQIRHRWEAEYGRRFDEAAKRQMDKIREAEKARTQAERDKDKAEQAAEAFKSNKSVPKGDGKKATTMTEDSIRKAAIRVAATTEDKNLKIALLELLRDTVDETPKEAKAKKSEEKESRHEEGKSIDVGDYLKEQGHKEDAAKWEKHEGDMGKKSSAAVVFPEIHDLAWRHVINYSRQNSGSKTASGSTAQRVVLADRLAKKWIQDAIKRQGRLHEYLGVPEGGAIPMDKLAEATERAKKADNKPLLAAFLLAKRLTGMSTKKAGWLTEESLTKAATEVWGSEHLAKKWIQDAIKRPGRVHEYLGVPEGEEIPMGKLNEAIEKVKGTGNKSLLSALLLAKRLKKGLGKKAEEAAA